MQQQSHHPHPHPQPPRPASAAPARLSLPAEHRLIAAAQSGDRAALSRLVEQYLPLVRAAGRQRCVRAIAEDATAAAAEELVRSIYAFDTTRGTAFAAYAKIRVYGAVSHLLRKESARWQRECLLAGDETPDDLPAARATSPAATAGPAPRTGRPVGPAPCAIRPAAAAPDAFAAADARAMLAQPLAALPAAERRVVQLLFFEGRTNREAAAILGCAPSTVQRQKQKALAHLRAALGEAAPSFTKT